MELENNTPFSVFALPFMGPGDQPVVTVVVKGSFNFSHDSLVTIAENQAPIEFADKMNDEEKGGSVRFESDMAPFKPKADVVLVGKAYAPEGNMIQAIDVSLRVGKLRKVIRVFGDRHWNVVSEIFKETPSVPKPFSSMEIVYERAFGGIDMAGGGYCRENLVGTGYYVQKKKKEINGLSLPNIEDPGNLIKTRKDCPKPVGFGFYGRAWEPRLGYLGTYDEKWKKEKAPGLPEDFSFQAHNGAHPDLVMDDYLKGDEEVELKNLSPDGENLFRLPGISPACSVKKYQDTSDGASLEDDVTLNLDTLCIVPDEKCFFLTWRGICPVQDLSGEDVQTIQINW